jgi:hypothetical protein
MPEITALQLTAGVATHVTVVDHNNADAPLPPASISWAVLGGSFPLSGIVADATGFNLTANSPMTATLQATYNSGSVHVPGPQFAITVVAAVQPAYISP